MIECNDKDFTVRVVKYEPMENLKIAIEHFELMEAMSHMNCNPYRLAKEIRKLTGWPVTTDQVTKMCTVTGMASRYATDEVKRFLFPPKKGK